MPLRFSIFSVSRKAFPSSTLPAFLIAPEARRSASESVVFPASTCAVIPVMILLMGKMIAHETAGRKLKGRARPYFIPFYGWWYMKRLMKRSKKRELIGILSVEKDELQY